MGGTQDDLVEPAAPIVGGGRVAGSSQRRTQGDRHVWEARAPGGQRELRGERVCYPGPGAPTAAGLTAEVGGAWFISLHFALIAAHSVRVHETETEC